jgi:hypothetical protein
LEPDFVQSTVFASLVLFSRRSVFLRLSNQSPLMVWNQTAKTHNKMMGTPHWT